MPKKAEGLNALKVKNAKAAGMFADGGGLYLQVTTTGARTWILRYKLAGRRRDMGLGSAAVVTLADARDKAAEAMRQVKAGVDPIDSKRTAAAEKAAEASKLMTFRQCAEAMIESRRAGWKSPKHAGQWVATLEAYAFPKLGALPVGAVDTNLVVQVIEPLWATKTETASRLRGRIEATLDYAKVRGFRVGENPARWRGHLDQILPAKGKVARVEHHASLPYEEMPAFWPRLQVQDGLGARALELAILTAGRSGEVLGATWDEVDLDARLWTIPAGRMKASAEHRVPLTEPALALLRKLATIRTGAYVFPGQRVGKPLSNMAMAMVLRRMGLDVTPHGFRSTFRVWAAEKTRFPDAVVEAALAHTIDDKVVAAYQRSDLLNKRVELMRAWAAFCASKVPSNVIRLQA